ncbi:hypothetical protein C8Q78DRAFT_394522 [Trametes maxima]|nr:hypothetical protein C8Q78DRAFT_394522 [Trametes maxima]
MTPPSRPAPRWVLGRGVIQTSPCGNACGWTHMDPHVHLVVERHGYRAAAWETPRWPIRRGSISTCLPVRVSVTTVPQWPIIHSRGRTLQLHAHMVRHPSQPRPERHHDACTLTSFGARLELRGIYVIAYWTEEHAVDGFKQSFTIPRHPVEMIHSVSAPMFQTRKLTPIASRTTTRMNISPTARLALQASPPRRR